MSNRELLELAAKAAGYDVVWNEHWQCFQHRNPSPDKFGNVRHPWVPLDDDGDTLRLANKLRMRIEHHICHPYVAVFAGVDFDKVKAEEPEGDDVDAATRRSIVRAAAEIGRGM